MVKFVTFDVSLWEHLNISLTKVGVSKRYRVCIQCNSQDDKRRPVNDWHTIVEYESVHGSLILALREAINCSDIQPYLWK